MANKSSFMLAVLLIANPVVMLFFQNCSGNVAQSKMLTSKDRQNTTTPSLRLPASESRE